MLTRSVDKNHVSNEKKKPTCFKQKNPGLVLKAAESWSGGTLTLRLKRSSFCWNPDGTEEKEDKGEDDDEEIGFSKPVSSIQTAASVWLQVSAASCRR